MESLGIHQKCIYRGNEDIPEREISYIEALKIGFFQVIAMIPGVSRSASTIIGGMTQKFSKKQAAEFSFFLAVPTMFAATAYKLLKGYEAINSSNIILFWDSSSENETIYLGLTNQFVFWCDSQGNASYEKIKDFIPSIKSFKNKYKVKDLDNSVNNKIHNILCLISELKQLDFNITSTQV